MKKYLFTTLIIVSSLHAGISVAQEKQGDVALAEAFVRAYYQIAAIQGSANALADDLTATNDEQVNAEVDALLEKLARTKDQAKEGLIALDNLELQRFCHAALYSQLAISKMGLVKIQLALLRSGGLTTEIRESIQKLASEIDKVSATVKSAADHKE